MKYNIIYDRHFADDIPRYILCADLNIIDVYY